MNLLDVLVALRQLGATLRREDDRLYLLKPQDVEIPPLYLRMLRENREEAAALAAGFAGRAPQVGATALNADGDRYPLSVAQGRWLKSDHAGQDHKAMVMLNALCLEEPVDPDLIERAVNAVVARHEILRTAYGETDGIAMQTILPHHPLPMLRRRFDPEAGSDEHEAVRRLGDELLETEYDLARGEVLRYALLETGAGRAYLLVGIHHIAADGRSLYVLQEEFLRMHAALREGAVPETAGGQARYVDYVEFERIALADPRLKDYYRRAVTIDYGYNEIPVLGDYRNTDLSARRIELVLDAERTAQIRRVLALAGASKAAFLLGLLALTLRAFVTRADRGPIKGINFGMPVAGHPNEQWHDVVGCLANMTVVSVDLSDLEMPFAAFAAATAQRIAGNIENRYLPFPRLMRMLEVPAGNRMFQVSFNMIAAPPSAGDGARLRMSRYPLSGRGRTSLFDFALFVDDRRDTATLAFEYRTSQLDHAFAQSIVDAYARMLDECLHAVPAAPRDVRLIDLLRVAGGGHAG